MASTFSQTLRLELIGDGDQSGIWGQTTNNNLGALIEQAITGVVNITMLDANYTLTNFNGVEDEARNAVLVLGGTNAAVRDVIAPLVEKVYVVRNATSGGFAVNIRAATGAAVSIPNGGTVLVYCDGTNFNAIGTESVGNFEVNGNLTVTGNTNAVAATYTGNVAALNLSTANVAATGNVSATGNATATNFIGGGLTLTSINASNVSTGTIANARTTANSANGASTIVVRDADGSFAANVGTFVTVSGTYSGNGAGLTDINASNISSGTINNIPIGTSTANTGAFTTLAYTGTLTGGTGVINIGSGQVYKDVSGNFGVGTSSPNSKITIGGGGANRISFITPTNSNYVGYDGSDDVLQVATSTSVVFQSGSGYLERMRIDANGNVGIGNTNPSFSLGPFEGLVLQSQGVSSQIRLYSSGSSGLADTDGAAFSVFGKLLYISNKENDDILFDVNDTEAMRLKPNGNLEVAGQVTAKDFTGVATNAREGGQINLDGGTSYTGFQKSIDVFDQDLRIIGAGNYAVQIISTTGTASLAVQGSLFFNSGYGSAAVAYGCRAWVNLFGTGTPGIRASGNVSSITDNGTGSYTVNFTTALVDNHYAAVATAEHAIGVTRSISADTTAYTTSNFNVDVGYGTTQYDSGTIVVAVFR